MSAGRAAMTAAVVLTCVALASCSAQAAVSVEAAGGRLIAVSGVANDAQEQALFEGSFMWGDGGCLATEPRDGGDSFLVVFPKGTVLDGEQIVLPEGYRFRAGEEVGLGGGFHASRGTNADLGMVPEECLTEEIFWASGEVVE